jgi:hypothetical protein
MNTNNINDMPKNMMCPCGGGQSCIVDRRWVGDWTHEDEIMIGANLPVRKNCFTKFTKKQQLAFDNELKKLNIIN